MWDDDSQSTNNMQTFEESGFPVGRGRGFSMSNIKDSLPKIGDKSAFSNSAPVDDSGWNDDSGWDEGATTTNNNSTNSWSNNNSQSNSYGRDNSNSYGRDSNNSYGSKPNRTCYKCQQEGHISKNCPNTMPYSKSGFNKRGTECFKCKQEGHMSRDCPNSGGGGGGGGGNRSCFKCGEEGHMSRDCTSSGGNKSSSCYKCGEEGHMSRDCTSSGGNKSSSCYKCGEEGHMSRDCTSSGGPKKSGCFKCGEEGHMSRECPNAGTEKKSSGCFKCGEEGHMSRECPNAGNEKKSSGCYKCGQEGHMSRDCPDGGGEKKSGCFKCGEDGHMAKDCTNPDTRTGPDGKPRPPIYIPPEMSEDAADVFDSVSAGINFSKYEKIAVDVSGDNAVPPFRDFKDSNLCQLLLKNVERSGYTKPTPVQKNAIPNIMNKRDIMACAETGSGKTAAFMLPMINSMIQDSNLPNNNGKEVQEPVAVILAPTRELAIQIMAEARKFAYDSVVKAEVIYGGTSTNHQSNRIKRGIHILVATPGRLLDFVEKEKVSFANVKYFVLDEADRMLDMGFMPAVEKCVDHPTMPKKGVRQTLMFSATFAPEIQKLAAKFLDNYLFLTVGTVGGANADVEQIFFKLGQFEKRQKLMDILKESGTDRVLVFVEQKRTADFLASFTSQNNIPTTSIHGDRMQKEREEALRDFRNGKMPVLVATAVAARGLDIKDVRHVINYDLPQSIDEYVHRIGRTGRVGNLGKATSFYDSNVDQPLAGHLKKILMDAQQNIPDWLHEEAANSSGPISYSGGRGGFGGRDIRNQSRKPNSSDAWENAPASTDNYSQSVDNDESWD